jgi:hypothetical protein|tara:strand:- start:63 stop:281 length:219 start_codon:yes stop_codon:yes gene_type:complete
MTDSKSYHFTIKEVNILYQVVEASSLEEAKKEFKHHLKDANSMRDRDLDDNSYFEVLRAEPFSWEIDEGTIV